MCENEICSPHTVLLHNAEELDDDLGRWSDEDLSLSGLLGVVDGIKRIVLHQRVRVELVWCSVLGTPYED